MEKDSRSLHFVSLIWQMTVGSYQSKSPLRFAKEKRGRCLIVKSLNNIASGIMLNAYFLSKWKGRCSYPIESKGYQNNRSKSKMNGQQSGKHSSNN